MGEKEKGMWELSPKGETEDRNRDRKRKLNCPIVERRGKAQQGEKGREGVL